MSARTSSTSRLHQSTDLPLGEGVGLIGCQIRYFPPYKRWPIQIDKGVELLVWFRRRLHITQHFHRAPPPGFDKLTLPYYDVAPSDLDLEFDNKVWLRWGKILDIFTSVYARVVQWSISFASLPRISNIV